MFFSSTLMFLFSLPPFFSAIYMLNYSIFLSIEIPVMYSFSMNLPVSFLLDWTSMMFLSTVMFISSMILLFSVEYMPSLEHKKFSLILLSFVLSMALLIMSDNIIFMLLGWDGLGLTSFVLVIYYQNASSAASGAITIFSNRLGDILILLSIAFLTSACNWNFSFNEFYPKIIIIFITLAACTKSAQFPFSAWLPAAMAAPTPISALVHSSTLVTAGVYLLIRILNHPHSPAVSILLVISSMTAVYASLTACWEMDMKKIIAYSTLSQIAMMMFALALGSTTLAFFHLIIHALFKSMMFLCAGVIIHSSSYQDMRSMGTMMNNSPLVASILGIASMSLMGIPFLSGFFSKDPIIENVIFLKPLTLSCILMIMSVGMTALYSSRMISLSWKFFLKYKPDINIHPSNFMELPILMMAPLSLFMGNLMTWIYTPEQIIIIPNKFKFIIILSLLVGILIGTMMGYKTKKYKYMGQPAISIWFIHFISTMFSPSSTNSMFHFLKNDKLWQEAYGPNFTHLISTHSSIYPDKMSMQMMFVLMMLTLYPILMIPF